MTDHTHALGCLCRRCRPEPRLPAPEDVADLTLLVPGGYGPPEQSAPPAPPVAVPDYWSARTVADAIRARVRRTVVCADGVYVP